MKTKHAFLALAAFPLMTAAVQAGDPPAAQTAPPASSITRWADRCTNFTTNGWAFKAPRNFLQWLEVFSDPGIWLEFGRRGLDPQYMVGSLDSLMDPGTPRNYLEWSNPEIYSQWVQAASEPEFYTAVNTLLYDPGRLMRWIMLPVDGRAWDLVGTAISPATWLKWLNAPADPKVQALFARAADPETARRWLEALGDPKNTPWLISPPTPYGAQATGFPGAVKPSAPVKLSL